jgi:ABC-2 type transport system permease protein
MVGGLLQSAAMTAAPDLMAQRGFEMFEKLGAVITPEQKQLIDNLHTYFKSQQALATQPSSQETGPAGLKANAGLGSWAPVPVKVVDVLGSKDKSPAVSFYAAGTAVMFLLFMASGAGGALLDDEERGVLDRLLSSRLGMGRLLGAHWIYITSLCVLQVTIMFVWGAVAFGINLWTPQHLEGFAVMTIATAAAAGGFGLVFATACRTRAQLHGISTIVILIMSAVGGSMFPRFLMQEWMRKIGLVTFNAWALDGFQKVFWYEKTVPELWPQVLVLVSLTIVFLFVARLLARRWEAN